ncbi:MAG: GAF domain-containing protein [Pseudomonadota bacterium]
MTGCFELPRLLDTILQLVDEVFKLDTCAVLLFEEEGGYLRIERARGYEPEVVSRFIGRPGEGITGRVFCEGQPVFVADVRSDPSYIGGVSGAVAEVAAPMRLNGRIIGVLDAEIRRACAFTEEDLQIFATFADHAAVAVRNAKLHDELAMRRSQLEREVSRLNLLGKAAQALSSSLDFDEVLHSILALAREALRFDHCAVLLLDQDVKRLRIQASVGYDRVVSDLNIPVGEGITGQVAQTGKPVLVDDVTSSPSYIPGVSGGRCEMAAPLVARGRTIGVLDAESTETGAYNGDDLNLFATFALHAATALANAENHRELQKANEILHRNIVEMERMNRELAQYTITLNETNTKLEHRVNELITLQRASQTITSSLNLDETLDAIVEMTREIVHSSHSVIKLIDGESTNLLVQARHITEAECASAESRSTFGVPLRIGDRTIGSFEVERIGNGPFSDEERRLLETLASQAAIAIENARLFETTQRTYFETIRSLAQALEARDAYTKGHSERVTRYAILVAEALRIPEGERRVLAHAGLLHDIGKIGVADAILSKTSSLTAEDRQLIEKHPIFGDTIIGPLRFLEKVQALVRHHHERYDGMGYPENLKGETIPLGARIIAVVDSFDAMTSRRPYRAPLPYETAVKELRQGAGTQFDPDIVRVFLKILETHGVITESEGDMSTLFERLAPIHVGGR